MKTQFTTVFKILSICFLTQLSYTSHAQTKALDFSNYGYVTIPYNSKLELGTGAFTLEAEILCQSSTIQSILSNRQNVSGITGFLFGLFSDGTLFVQIDGAPNIGANYGPSLTDNSCHQVALTRSNDTLRFYVDGRLTYSSIRNTSMSSPVNLDSYIGYDKIDDSDYFNGQISNVRIWNIARSSSDIAAYATKGLPVNSTSPGILASWNMNEGTGQFVYDGTPNPANGFLGATTATGSDDPAWVTSSCAASLVTGISNQLASELSSIKVYPNPFVDVVTIESPSTNYSVELISPSGQTLISKESKENTIVQLNLEKSLSPGLYFIKVTQVNEARIFKLTKN